MHDRHDRHDRHERHGQIVPPTATTLPSPRAISCADANPPRPAQHPPTHASSAGQLRLVYITALALTLSRSAFFWVERGHTEVALHLRASQGSAFLLACAPPHCIALSTCESAEFRKDEGSVHKWGTRHTNAPNCLIVDIDIDIDINRRVTANTPQRPNAFPSVGYQRRLDSSGRACRPRVVRFTDAYGIGRRS